MSDTAKRNDQVRMLRMCRDFTTSGIWSGMFSYPNCGYDLVRQGLANENKTITEAGRAALEYVDARLVPEDRRETAEGRAALWFLAAGPDPTDGASFVSVELPARSRSADSAD